MEPKENTEKENSNIGINSNTSNSQKNYFGFYSQLQNQQGMICDNKRTKTYYNSIIYNPSDFVDKTIMDVGTGTGLLALFCALNGAQKVHAIEASESAKYAEKLINANNLSEQIILINKKLEEISPSQIPHNSIDLIISEPLGVLLLNERMIETLLIARDKYLKPGSKIFPTTSTIYFVPFTDNDFYETRCSSVQFWNNSNFYGINFTSLYEDALKEKFSKPIIDAYNPKMHLTNHFISKNFDFRTVKVEELLNFKVELDFSFDKACVINGIAGWFDTLFIGTNKTVLLSTSPFSNVTHWYQIRFFFKDPIAVNKGSRVVGEVEFKAHEEQSYFIRIFIKIEGGDVCTEGNYNLKDTEFWGLSRNGGVNNWCMDQGAEEAASIMDGGNAWEMGKGYEGYNI